MKERPIIFSGDSVMAILDGRKTQTRRVVLHPEKFERIRDCAFLCPYGQPGDRLWVRETWCYKMDDGRYIYNKDGNRDPSCCWYKASDSGIEASDEDGSQRYNKDGFEASPWVSPILMPRWASRITLEIVNVQVQRIQEISPEDCYAEGIDPDARWEAARYCFGLVWDYINRKRNPSYDWYTNPWVWMLSFKVIN